MLQNPWRRFCRKAIAVENLKTLLLAMIISGCAMLWSQGLEPRQLIIKTSSPISIRSDRTGITEFDWYLDSLGAFNLRRIKGMHTDRYFVTDLQRIPDWNNFNMYSFRNQGIEYIQPNRFNKEHLTPNDPLFPNQLHHLSAVPQAWNYTTGSPLIIVGVVDSGILREHPDLAANLYINPNEAIDGTDTDGNGYVDDWCGWDFSDAPEMADVALGDFMIPDNDVTDENFHGTHVSGIIGAVGNNGIGIAGVAWNVRIMPLRAGFRTAQGSGYLQDDDAAAALIYAADNGCHVINMSWGDPNYSPIIADACDYAYEKGVILIASAGNDPGPNLSYPAKLSNVISVGAVNKFKNLAGFSSYGVDLDLVAPGEQVLSTYKLETNEQYMEMSGTSMAAPYVSGSIALMLSLQPGLSPAEVRSRLLNSTDDLGPIGFDIHYGHGLLNVQKLLLSLNPPIVEISYPYDQMGIRGSIDILGTVHGENFFRYSVMYSDKAVPSQLDWMDVATHTNQPQFYYQPVQNGYIATFDIPEVFPEGRYSIRIQYETGLGRKYNYYRYVNYDNSAPVLITPSLFGFSRFDRQNKRYYISAKFNESVRSELLVQGSDNILHTVNSVKLDSLQIWALPQNLPQGSINIQIKAHNSSGISYESPQFQDFLNIQYSLVPNHGYVSNPIGNARVPLPRTHDFDGNGVNEYISMDLPVSGYGNVSIVEPTATSHFTLHSFADNFWPLDIGHTNASGLELLYLSADTAKLLETKPGSVYPDSLIWTETAISGGVIADYSGDNIKEILLVKNLPAARVIQAYARTSSGNITPRNTLSNTTATSQRNTFVPTIIVDNFDGDNFPDILTADTDGDIMIFEIYNNNSQSMTWSHRLPVGNAYYLCAGDFDGNGRKDFMVGGNYTDILNPDMNFWYFEGFTRASNDSYTSMGSVMFNEIRSQNAISAFDLDNDGKDEIILALTPNLYVLKYENGAFVPQFHAESFRTFQICNWRDESDKAYFLTNAKVSEDEFTAMQWTAAIAYTGPLPPANFFASPLSESSIKLSWADSNAQSYSILRKRGDEAVQRFDNIFGNEYYDTDLESGAIYQYAIIAHNPSFTPSASFASEWVSVTPAPIPQVVSINMHGSRDLRILFNQQMPASIINPGYYYVDNAMGHPYTVNAIQNQYGVQLRFAKNFEDIDIPYSLFMRNVKGSTGVPIGQQEYSFTFVQDTNPPRIVSTRILPTMDSIEIMFDEEIHATSAGIIDNYSFQSPANDPQNGIRSVSVYPESVQIVLHAKLKSSDQPYFTVVNNISDLAGNLISPNHNIAKFGLTEFSDLSQLVVYPNPVKTAKNQQVTFLNFPTGKKGRISIYNSSGDIVYDSQIGPFNPLNNYITWSWNLNNNDGRKVSSGIYFYLIEMGSKSKRGKIAVIR